jgi:ATP-binding cassette subfamily A (ABC1) protein 1
MFTFLIPLYYLVSKLAEEKESRSREGMKMMGLKDASYFLSWFVFYVIVNLVQAAVITAMVCINLFTASNKLLIFLHCFLFGTSLFGFAVIVVSILPTVRASATAATLIHLITYFFMFSLKNPDVSPRVKQAMSVFPNVAMSLGVYNLYDFEANQGGLDFSNVQQPLNGITFLFTLVMLAFDSILLTLLGLYLDQVLQSQFGVAKKWNFLCTRQFCCPKKPRQSISDEADEYRRECLLNGACSDEEDQVLKANPEDFEPVPEAIKRQEQSKECLKIRGLRREFG